MQAVIDDFDERVAEVEQYLKVLERLEQPNIVLHHRATGRSLRVLQEDSLKVMKATVFLLVYNVVESAIRSAFAYLYTQIESDGALCDEIIAEIRNEWIRQQFQLDEDSASLRNFRDLAETVANAIINKTSISLSPKLLPISGNLDADGIRKVCRKHGIPVTVHYRASGGVELQTVKTQRNALAHGNTSFSACGQQYTVSDLKRIKQQAFIFVRSTLRNLRNFVDGQRYVTRT